MALVSAVGWQLGCQLMVGVDELQDRRCPDTEKICEGRCVPKSDPQTGCAGLMCAPCSLLNASSKCGSNGECEIRQCTPGYRSCNDTIPGCEVDLQHDPKNCMECGVACADPPHAKAGCSDAQCVIGRCDEGWEDCETTVPGCETQIWTDEQCGYCNEACPPATTCDRGTCRAVAGQPLQSVFPD